MRRPPSIHTDMDLEVVAAGVGQTAAGPSERAQACSKQLPDNVAAELLDAALRIWDEDGAAARSHVAVVAAMLHRASDGTNAEHAQSHASGLAPWQMRKVTEFIDAALETRIRVVDCAKQVRLSASHFSAAFKATFGTTAARYIRYRRVEHAQRLMLMSEMPLSQVAAAAGFSDQAHYSRVFREVTGTRPSAWRHQNMTLAPIERKKAASISDTCSDSDDTVMAPETAPPASGMRRDFRGMCNRRRIRAATAAVGSL